MCKAERAGKTKIKHVEFYKQLLEIYEDTINFNFCVLDIKIHF